MATDTQFEEGQLADKGSRSSLDAELRAQGVVLVERGIYRDAARRFAKNKLAIIGLVITLALVALAVFADDSLIAVPLGREPKPLLARSTYNKISFGPGGEFPSTAYWMGTDTNGRDLFSRIVYGTRVSLTVGILAQLIACTIGIPLGSIAGWRGGRVDFLVMRLVDVMSAIPTLLFAYLVMTWLGSGFWNVMLAIGITSWISICRLTRAQFLALREKEFIEAARMMGAGPGRIVRMHLLPNSLAPIIVSITLGIPSAIFAEASLSFLGVGINPPMPSWGQMLGREGITNMTYYWHLALFPAIMIAITMMGFTFIGDGLRDALDPHMLREK